MHPMLFNENMLFHSGSEMSNLNYHCSLLFRVDDVHVNLDETSPPMLL